MLRVNSWRLLVLFVAAGLMAAVPLRAAHAADPATQLASDNPYNFTPRILDGQVEAIEQIGNTVYVGGDFTQIQAPDDAAPVLNRPYLFAFNATTGQILDSFAATVNKSVRALLPSSDGTQLYIGGQLTQVNGVTRSHVGLVNATTGARINAFKPPKINGEVFDLRLRGSQLLVAGSFGTVDGLTQRGMASLDATTGVRTNYLTNVFNGTAWGKGVTTVRNFDVTPNGERMVVQGNFNSVDGQTRLQIAMLDLTDSGVTLANWNTTRFIATGSTAGSSLCARAFDSYMRDVDISPDGSFFVVVTTGAYRSGTLCDTASRWEMNATGTQTESWSTVTGGDTFWAVEVTGPIAYVGGHFRWLNNPYAADRASVGAVPREGIAAIDTRNGLPLSWNPGRERGVGLFDFEVTDSEVWAGSDTDRWASEYRPRIAGFPLAGGHAMPVEKTGALPGDVVLLDSPANGISQDYRNFDGTSVLGSQSAGNADDWSFARGAVMIDDTVYMGWADSTTTGSLRSRTFDGTNFGPATTMELYANGLSTDSRSFNVDIPRITGMFYDKSNGRLYYTLRPTTNNQSGGFFYRYFSPESGVVGAQRFTATNGSLIGATSNGNTYPRGMFRDGNNVYFVDSAGDLKRIAYTPGVAGAPGGVTGSVTTVETVLEWRANASFVSTKPTSVGPNTLPTAALTADCGGLTCEFDASASQDPDGSIATYAFDFGDGTTAAASAESVVEHTYQSAGDYNVTVTVTDTRGGTDTETIPVNPAPIVSPIQFRTAQEYASASSLANHSLVVPNDVQAGDQLVLVATSSGAGTVTTPPGWTLLDQQLDVDTRSVVFTKTASAADPGATVSLQWSASAKVIASLAAYGGVAGVPAVVGAIETGGAATTAHTTPATTVPVDGAWVLSYWSDKNQQTTSWTPPAGQVVRADPPVLFAAGVVRVTSLLTDDGGPAADGSRLGLTATADSGAAKGTLFTIMLSPAE